ncbi:S6 family peptidase [Mannheimia haemolytica]|uniref:S6 family peptidase n=2 Tax=Mannheimia haemolytica TaxID=75985 RepID=UPI002EB4CD6E|nr:S6 family peptidase [Mannheimia haemolytica]
MFIRAGSGTQYILAEKNAVKEKLADPYAYLIGGTPLKLTSNNANTFVFKGNVFDDSYSPLSSHPQQGDSGSGMFAWDNRLNRRVYIATLQSGNDDFTVSVVNHPEYGDLLEQEDTAGTISDSGKTLTWTALGNSSRITGATAELVVDLSDTSLPDPTTGKPHKPSLHHGKTLKISGDGNTLNLANNINQGAGALYFSGNAVVTGASNEMTTWLGAGISVDKNKNVEWQVHNPVGDRLSKIGEGTLTVSGKGKNLGSISVGDGTVILNQQAGENGEKSAFSEVGIVSGRPTVILNSADQVDPNSIYFGYRGGRLDLNGNSLTFNRIQNVDDGARIVNNNAGTTANISLVGQVFTANDVRTINFGEGYNADLFRSQGAYFVLENNAWKFISWNHDDAKKYVVEKKNKALENQLYAYNGYFGESDSSRENGKLNIHFKPINAGGKLLLTGGTTLDGILSAENDAEIILSGRPIPYALQVLDENKKTINKEIIKEGEWINRTFSATTFQAKDNRKIEVSRNVVEVNGNFNLSDNATAQVGFTQGKSQSCVRSDRTGIASCNLSVLSDKDLHSWQRTTVNSDIKLTQNARFELGSKADLIGTIESNGDSQINLRNGSSWVMTGNSNVNKLNVDNATITLDNNVGEPNTLNINSLSGSGVINFITYFAQTISDLINVEHASGAFKAKISQIGTPTNDQKIKLLETKSENNFNFGAVLDN